VPPRAGSSVPEAVGVYVQDCSLNGVTPANHSSATKENGSRSGDGVIVILPIDSRLASFDGLLLALLEAGANNDRVAPVGAHLSPRTGAGGYDPKRVSWRFESESGSGTDYDFTKNVRME
jgi:hypothetical protein